MLLLEATFHSFAELWSETKSLFSLISQSRMLKSITCLLDSYFKPHLLVWFFSFNILEGSYREKTFPSCCCVVVRLWQRDSVTARPVTHDTTSPQSQKLVQHTAAIVLQHPAFVLSLWSVEFFNLDTDTVKSKQYSEKAPSMETSCLHPRWESLPGKIIIDGRFNFFANLIVFLLQRVSQFILNRFKILKKLLKC